LMASPDGFTGPVNLGNSNEMTVLQLAENIIRMTNSRSQIIRKPLPADDPRQRQPDAALAKKQLGWSAMTPLEDGLARTIAYFDELLQQRGPELRAVASAG
ncbi:MAG: SDR family NAD-dependent epimerase/dehydratase, partial [Burkholderiaceae bacterium]